MFVLLGGGLPNLVQAHPHIFISMKQKILFTPDGRLEAISHEWLFDEGYSAFAVQGLDPKGDGVIPPEILKALAKSNAEAMAEFDYFTFVKAGGHKIELGDPRDFEFSYVDKKLLFRVTLPIKQTIVPPKITIFETFDPTYFIAFSYSDGPDPVTLANDIKGCKINIVKPTADPQPAWRLDESFYNSLGKDSTVGLQFASRIIMACP
jgi:ABC-type uncharacterized transport system substrate-binding protein